jgi:transposase
VLLAEDETDLLLFPPLRAAWGRRGEETPVSLSGRNARRVVFGALNPRTGRTVFLDRHHPRQPDFQAFLKLVHHRYRGWNVAMLLDEHPCHTAAGSRRIADELGIRLLWLPKRCPELNPMDHLWGKAKAAISANLQRATIDEHIEEFLDYLRGLSPEEFLDYLRGLSPTEVLRAAGVLSKRFWLRSAL